MDTEKFTKNNIDQVVNKWYNLNIDHVVNIIILESAGKEMNRDEKNLQSKQKILNSAIKEFANNPYALASLNNVCKDGKISKGIIYHYFKDKDQLYLCCVQQCFDALGDFLSQNQYEFQGFSADIAHYMSLRNQFFAQNEQYRNLFFNALLQPPKHLSQQIGQIKSKLECANRDYCKRALRTLPLKEGVTPDMAVFYFSLFQDAFNGYFQNQAENCNDFDLLIGQHEEKIAQMIDILLYGIAKEEKEQ